MSKKPHWQGVFPAITTQMKRDGSIDFDATAKHVEALLDSGVSGLIFLGSLGENQVMTPDEKRTVLDMAVKVVFGRVPVLSGVAEASTAEAVRFVHDAGKLGVDGVMLMPAMLYKGDPRETLTHFKTVAKSTDLPIMIYNNPISYANDLTPEMFAELGKVRNFVALKESSGDVRRICTTSAATASRSSPASMTSRSRRASSASTAGWPARASPSRARTSISGS
jgi:1-pyrroline-4-hydroxy-2-carboxylate deaminase